MRVGNIHVHEKSLEDEIMIENYSDSRDILVSFDWNPCLNDQEKLEVKSSSVR